MSRASILRGGTNGGGGTCLTSARHQLPATVQLKAIIGLKSRRLAEIPIFHSGRRMLYLCLSCPASARIPSHKPCGQPDTGAECLGARSVANKMEFNLHTASCWFAQLIKTAVYCLLCSDFCRMEGKMRVADASAYQSSC